MAELDHIRFDAVAIYGSVPTLADGIQSWEVRVAVRHADGLREQDRVWFERWLDDTFPGHGPIEEDSDSFEHDCPTCMCRDDRIAFTCRLAARDRDEIDRALGRLSPPARFEVAS